MKFNHNEIPNIYEKVDIKEDRFEGFRYTFFGEKNSDYFYLIVHKERGYGYYHDNFPAPKKYFSSDIPIKTFEDFERDLERMNIPVPKRLKKQQKSS